MPLKSEPGFEADPLREFPPHRNTGVGSYTAGMTSGGYKLLSDCQSVLVDGLLAAEFAPEAPACAADGVLVFWLLPELPPELEPELPELAPELTAELPALAAEEGFAALLAPDEPKEPALPEDRFGLEGAVPPVPELAPELAPDEPAEAADVVVFVVAVVVVFVAPLAAEPTAVEPADAADVVVFGATLPTAEAPAVKIDATWLPMDTFTRGSFKSDISEFSITKHLQLMQPHMPPGTGSFINDFAAAETVDACST